MAKIVVLTLMKERKESMDLCISVPDDTSHTGMKGVVEAVCQAVKSGGIKWVTENREPTEYWSAGSEELPGEPEDGAEYAVTLKDGAWEVKQT